MTGRWYDEIIASESDLVWGFSNPQQTAEQDKRDKHNIHEPPHSVFMSMFLGVCKGLSH